MTMGKARGVQGTSSEKTSLQKGAWLAPERRGGWTWKQNKIMLEKLRNSLRPQVRGHNKEGGVVFFVKYMGCVEETVVEINIFQMGKITRIIFQKDHPGSHA